MKSSHAGCGFGEGELSSFPSVLRHGTGCLGELSSLSLGSRHMGMRSAIAGGGRDICPLRNALVFAEVLWTGATVGHREGLEASGEGVL